MAVVMFTGFFYVKTINKTRKRDYAVDQLQGEGNATLRERPAAKGPKQMTPIESLLSNWVRQWDKKAESP
ncbi:hypothetical protein MSPP1_002712 [Malassezia sp. CBS 17886]|nr:hypothetical protein MSPP1_002712 [Malassezia sp. CBS 17886]